MNNKEIQELLNRLLNQVKKDLKKRMFPRKHRQLLYQEVNIRKGKLEYPLLGTYKEHDTGEENIHIITIANWAIVRYINAPSGWKMYFKKSLKSAIAHELIHAFVNERYEFSSNYGFHKDGSPIFLSILAFLNIPSGHKAMISFKHTKMYNTIKNVGTFDELEDFLILKKIEYKNKFHEIFEIADIENKRVYTNEFMFSNGEVTGINGYLTTVGLKNEYLLKANLFEIGPMVDLNNLKELVLSKIERNAFKKKRISTFDNGLNQKQNKYKLQSMNV